MKLLSKMLFAAGVLALSGSAFAEEDGVLAGITNPHFEKDFGMSVGLKLWNNSWNKWGIPMDRPVSMIPVVSMRYKNFLFSGSMMGRTTYHNANTVPNFPIFRKETDLNLGYYLSRNIAVTVGYKQIDQDFTAAAGAQIRYSGPTVGISGSAALSGALGAYGSFAYGNLNYRDSFGAPRTGAPYYLSEVGLSYTFRPETPGMVQATSIYAGYRSQMLYANNAVAPGAAGLDTTEGLVAGVNVAF